MALNLPGLRIAIVYDWLVTLGGGERVLIDMLECYPQADLFVTVDFFSENQRRQLGSGRKINTSFIQRIPFAKKHYWKLAPLMPLAVELHDLRGYDLVLSGSHAFAKGVTVGPDQLHISYIHSPPRFAWDKLLDYLDNFGYKSGPKRMLASWLFHRIRGWDARSANGVDMMIANSDYIRRRIWKTYRRDALKIYPPVDVDRFQPATVRDDFYFCASFMNPFKRMDAVIDAFALTPQRRLIVAGHGPQEQLLRGRASANIEFLGWVSDEVMADHMSRARAFVFAAEEDFGIIVAEAQAAGAPVIGLARGGTAEIVRPIGHQAPTGVLFNEATPEAICEAIADFESHEASITPQACRENALRFSKQQFKKSFTALVDQAWRTWHRALREEPGMTLPTLIAQMSVTPVGEECGQATESILAATRQNGLECAQANPQV